MGLLRKYDDVMIHQETMDDYRMREIKRIVLETEAEKKELGSVYKREQADLRAYEQVMKIVLEEE